MSATHDHFPTDVDGLPEARSPEQVELKDGDELDLRVPLHALHRRAHGGEIHQQGNAREIL